jgi:hypothetical protein
MTDEPDRYPMLCDECEREVWAVESVFLRGHVNCDDCFFEQVGDMLTPNELRKSELRKSENAQLRDGWLERYRLAGIGDDQDPSSFTLSVPVDENTTVDEFFGRALGMAADAYQLRMSTPDNIE